jgi:hypothetical protein
MKSRKGLPVFSGVNAVRTSARTLRASAAPKVTGSERLTGMILSPSQ